MRAVPQKILIIGPAWVGDMVMAQVLFKQLKSLAPQVIIDVLAPPHSHALLVRMPEIRRALNLPIGHGELKLRTRWHIAQDLKTEKYDQAIVLPNSFKSALIPWLARIPIRTGWLGEMRYGLLNDYRKLDKQQYPLMIERFAALALARSVPLSETLPHPQLVVAPETVAAALTRVGMEMPTSPVVALCHGAEYGPAKRWPAHHHAALANILKAEGFTVWLLGSAKEQDFAAEIVQQAPHCVDLTGKTSLAEAIDLLSLSTVVVSNDSGLMHIAAALAKPLVALYGSSSPHFTPPLAAKVSIEKLDLSCSPCFARVCPLEHLNCLQQLLPQRVAGAVQQVLS